MTILRTLLFAPGDRPAMLQRSLASGADAVIWDLEDAVALSAKAEARGVVAQALRDAAEPAVPILVRVNALGTGLLDADLDAIDFARVAGVVLAKAERADDLCRLGEAVATREPRGRRVPLFAQIETCLGVVQAFAIAAADPRVAGLLFGGEDFTRDLGVARTRDGHELDYPRAAVAVAAVAAGVAAIDTVFTDLADEDGLRADCARARSVGLQGKLAIHPKQLPIIRAAFSPTDDERAWARRVVEAFDAAQAEGRGVTVLDGRMIDAPVVARARQWLEP